MISAGVIRRSSFMNKTRFLRHFTEKSFGIGEKRGKINTEISESEAKVYFGSGETNMLPLPQILDKKSKMIHRFKIEVSKNYARIYYKIPLAGFEPANIVFERKSGFIQIEDTSGGEEVIRVLKLPAPVDEFKSIDSRVLWKHGLAMLLMHRYTQMTKPFKKASKSDDVEGIEKEV